MDVCMALFFSKIPLVVSERNDPSIDPASNVKRLLRNVLYCRPNWFVFQTPDAKRYFSKKIQDRSNIVLNPLSGSIPDCWLGEREKRIVSVGRLNNQKNFPLLIEAFLLFHKKHPDYILEIYGDGMLEDKLKSYISDCQLEEFVFLKGFIKDVHDRIKKAAMFVMSSDFEGLPNALIEAMALGLPSISTDCPCGGPRMLIKDGVNGRLVSVNNVNELCDAMLFCAEEEHAEKLSIESRKIRDIVSREKIVSEWEALIHHIIEAK